MQRRLLGGGGRLSPHASGKVDVRPPCGQQLAASRTSQQQQAHRIGGPLVAQSIERFGKSRYLSGRQIAVTLVFGVALDAAHRIVRAHVPPDGKTKKPRQCKDAIGMCRGARADLAMEGVDVGEGYGGHPQAADGGYDVDADLLPVIALGRYAFARQVLGFEARAQIGDGRCSSAFQ